MKKQPFVRVRNLAHFDKLIAKEPQDFILALQGCVSRKHIYRDRWYYYIYNHIDDTWTKLSIAKVKRNDPEVDAVTNVFKWMSKGNLALDNR